MNDLASGAGEGGDPLHPDQDNAPPVRVAPYGIIEVDGAAVRAAAAAMYPGHPHALAYAERFAQAIDGGDGPAFSAEPRTPFQQAILDNLLTALSRS